MNDYNNQNINGMNNQPMFDSNMNNMNNMNNQPMFDPNMNNMNQLQQNPNNAFALQQDIEKQKLEADLKAEYGFCPNCGQKISNPKYCMHCGAETDLLVQIQKERKRKTLEEEKKEIKKKTTIYSNVYYVFLIIEVIGLMLVYKYLKSEVLVMGLSVLFAGEMSAGKLFLTLLPLATVVIYLIFCVKTLIYSLVNLKFEITLKGILTIILSSIGLISIILIILGLLLE